MSDIKSKVAALIGVGALAWLTTMLPREEGLIYKGYLDILGIPTKCSGDTRNVVVGKVYSKAECEQSLMQAIYDHAKPLYDKEPSLKDAPDSIRAVAISLSYKAGPYSPIVNTFLTDVKKKDYESACKHVIFNPKTNQRWYISGRTVSEQKDLKTGKIIPKNTPMVLGGLVKRSDLEFAICVKDIGMDASKIHTINKAAQTDLEFIEKMRPAELEKLMREEK